MKKESLYNGKEFPDYVFIDHSMVCHIVEFSLIFDEEFWPPFKKLLEDLHVDRLSVENVQPEGFVFYDEINVSELPGSFFDAAFVKLSHDYISSGANFYTFTDIGLIYPCGNNNAFCLYLDRAYELAIIGFTNPIDIGPISEFVIKDLPDYLTVCFRGEQPPVPFIEQIYANYK